MVHLVGAKGPGAPDLITRRGAALLREPTSSSMRAVWVNQALTGPCKADCAIYSNS